MRVLANWVIAKLIRHWGIRNMDQTVWRIGFSESYHTRRKCHPSGMRTVVVTMEDTCTASESAASFWAPSRFVGAPIFCMRPPEFVPVDSWVFFRWRPRVSSKSIATPSTSLLQKLVYKMLYPSLLHISKLGLTHKLPMWNALGY